ncbi:unnamed protein product [Linum trigynum]|uniref:Uncharacterized protein n=1 Tax=Linum trigynum TaxID=586398 RepID=A0AAV2DPL7_9ROSI
MIGKPLWFDQSTRLGRRMGFPKVCVEMSIDSKFPETLKLVPDHKPAFEVSLEYCNRPVGCQKCRVFGHQCDNVEEVRAEVCSKVIEGGEDATGSAGQMILDSILASKGKAQESAEVACHNLNLAVANLVKSIEQGVLSEWQRVGSIELPSEGELQTAMVEQVTSPAREASITPVTNRYQNLAVESFEVGNILVSSPVPHNLDDFPVLEGGGKGKGKQGKKGPGRPAKPKPKK